VAARARPPHVLLSVRWHERHSARVAERYPGTTVWAPAGAVPKLARAPDRVFGARRPPAGVVALETARSDEVVLWLPRARTLFTGDTLLGGTRRPLRVCPQGWLPRGVTRTALAASLRPLLELPVELIVPAHGEPVASEPLAVLERALADAA
jgi:glyoxylase-like metal-dependent hydrolase (beta-lactamase superfamily II)